MLRATSTSSIARNVMACTVPPLLSALVGGLGWHFSSVLLRPERTLVYPDRFLTVREGLAWFVWSRWAERAGQWAVRWSGGNGRVGPPVGPAGCPRLGTPVCRPWLDGPLPPDGARVMFEASLYGPDPGVHGLAFTEVLIRTPVGDCPAWWVPAPDRSDTWVIAVHGRGTDRRECLRVLPTLHRLGLPVLAISYRNDLGAPPGPDGHYHLGDTEWLDLAAAVEWALDAGARRVVLYGWSMGAAMIGAYLDRAGSASGAVTAVVWDSPVLDWRATLRQQARLRWLPPGLAALATAVTRRRIGIDFDRFDLPRHPPAVRPPTLVFHGERDSAVPAGPARALAVAAAGLGWALRYVEVPGAEHTASWNVDPTAYERMLTEFLTRRVEPLQVNRD